MRNCTNRSLSLNVLQDMKPLKKQTLAQGVKTIVPSNYALSFDITPTGLHTGWSSIIQYTQDDTDTGRRGRIPGRLQYVTPFLSFSLTSKYLHSSFSLSKFYSTCPSRINIQSSISKYPCCRLASQ